jgi:hypothetical protein
LNIFFTAVKALELRSNCIVFKEILASIGDLTVTNAVLLGDAKQIYFN